MTHFVFMQFVLLFYDAQSVINPFQRIGYVPAATTAKVLLIHRMSYILSRVREKEISFKLC